ncbi:MAG: Gfo/Idh/MocA family oxidoreductase [Candidatus Hodarchaeota archaeon]
MDQMKIGIIGLDTSHVPSFTKLVNKDKKSGAKVLYGYPGGSDKCSVSYNRVGKFTMAVAQEGVEIIEEIDEIAEKSDAIFLLSCDGGQHLEQFEAIAPFKKPVYIDKPFTCSIADARKIIDISKQQGCPVFSASSLRYAKGIHGFSKGKDVVSAEVYGPVNLLEDYPIGWFWYGVHSIDILFEMLGPGVLDVQAKSSENVDIVHASWEGGKTATVVGYRYPKFHDWGVRLWTGDNMHDSVAANKPSYYEMMMPHVLEFFKTGKSPKSDRVLLEEMAFLEAVNASIETGEPKKIVI